MPRPVRVLLVDHTALMGGGEVALLNLVLGLDRRRYEPVVLLFSEGALGDKLRDAGVETHIVPLDASVINSRKDDLGGGTLLRLREVAATLTFTLELSRVIEGLNVAGVHTNSLKSDLIAGVAGRLAGVPVVWHVRDRIAADYLPAKVARLFRWASRVIPTRVIAISRAVAETLGNSHKVRVVYDGTPLPPEPPASGVDAHPFVVGLVGRISPWKGQDVFIRAAAIVRRTLPSVRFQIVGSALFGEDDFDREIRQLVRIEGLEQTIEFTGFRPDVAQVIDALDLVVHASIRGEPFGQVVIEGMAAGKPVIASHGGAIPEIVVDGQTGLIVPMNDPAALAEAICRLASNPQRAAEMGKAGRLRVVENFGIERTAAGVQAVYDELLGFPPCRPA